MKLVIKETASTELEHHFEHDAVLASSRIALVEVPRATKLANPSPEAEHEAHRLLGACLLVDVSDRVLRNAAALTSRAVRTHDAIHLATALYIDADELVAYDRRLLDAATAQGLSIASPGTV